MTSLASDLFLCAASFHDFRAWEETDEDRAQYLTKVHCNR